MEMDVDYDYYDMAMSLNEKQLQAAVQCNKNCIVIRTANDYDGPLDMIPSTVTSLEIQYTSQFNSNIDNLSPQLDSLILNLRFSGSIKNLPHYMTKMELHYYDDERTIGYIPKSVVYLSLFYPSTCSFDYLSPNIRQIYMNGDNVDYLPRSVVKLRLDVRRVYLDNLPYATVQLRVLKYSGSKCCNGQSVRNLPMLCN
jgi:hypothetical protein